MTLSDYAIDIALISLVLLQVRGRRLTAHSLLLPIGLVAYVAASYLHSVPTAGPRPGTGGGGRRPSPTT